MDAGDFSNAGVAEAAADGLFASLADLDWDYGGRVGGSNGLYDSNGNLIRKHGAVFNAPLHFIGFGQGAVVNTEIIQRLGTYFPEAGGVQDSGERDLMMTAVDPFEYNPESAPQFNGTFSRMLDPEIVVWDNVTYADNYYQVQGKDGNNKVLTGKELKKMPSKPDRADINYELENWAGFDRAKGEDNAHRAAVAWYGGTANLNESEIPADQQLVFRRLGDLILNDLGENNEKSWYVPGHTKSSFNHGDTKAPWEGIGTGWFYSVNGGGSKLRPYEVGSGTNKSKKSKDELGNFEDYLKNNRRPVTYDNTYAKGAVEKRLRGDYATPTVFNGNFDVVAPKNDPNAPLPNIPIPGWSDKSASVSMSNLVDWRKITTFRNERNNLGFEGTQLNYTLKLDRDNNNIVHNPQVVPDWGLLRLDLHAPGTTKDKRGELVVTLKTPDESIVHDQTIVLQKASNTLEKVPLLDDNNQPTGTEISIPSSYGGDRYKIDYGRNGFESFFIPVPETLRGKMVNVDLELRAEGQNKPKVYLDNVFFQSNTLKFGNPTAARNDSLAYSPNNYLIEKPQYTMSFNKTRNTPNWVSWTLDGSWPSKIPSSKRPGGFAEDPDLNGTNWYKINHNDYNFDAEVEKYYSDDEYKHFEVPERDFSPPLKPYFWPVRGHLSPSKDRSRSIKDLYSTFLTTNIVPQDLKGNSGVWREWEKHLQEKVKNFQHKIYVISGVLGTGGDGKDYNDFSQFNAQTNKDEKIAVPSKLWKVVMGFNKNSTSEYPDYAYATIVPNNALDLLNVEYNNKGKPKKVTPKKWTDFKKTINVLELALNKDLKDSDFRYDFLSNVKDPQIKERLKNTK
jgi:DNA/RNA endonuclease G (NUC1)